MSSLSSFGVTWGGVLKHLLAQLKPKREYDDEAKLSRGYVQLKVHILYQQQRKWYMG